jgi:hypothetical protein
MPTQLFPPHPFGPLPEHVQGLFGRHSHVPVHAACTDAGRSPNIVAPIPAAVAAMSFSAWRRGNDPAMARDSRSNCSSIHRSSVKRSLQSSVVA